MAYFRCGGGGVPASVKTDMNAVLNKKFGTSTDYPPADWAPTVNLMGPLPEKTQASASVCSFDDGADDVPTKSLVVTIPPTLSGVSSVTETQTGRNLCPNSFEQGTFSEGAPVGSVYANMKYGNTIRGRSTDIFRIDNGNVNISCADGYQLFITLFGSDEKYLGQYVGWTTDAAITNSSAYYIAVAFKRNDNGTITDTDFEAVHVMCLVGSSASTYEPYTPTTYTADLGRTIYGGTADIVNGTGTETEKGKWLSELSWTQNATFPHVFNGTGFTDRKKGINWNNATCLSDRYTGYTSSEVGTKSEGIALATGATNTTIYVSDDRFETVAEFTTSLVTDDSFVVLPLETPTDFTFTPITPTPETALGTNNFWADEGDSTVVYRADIDLLLGGN